MNQMTENQIFDVIDTIPSISAPFKELQTQDSLLTLIQIPQVKLQEQQTDITEETSNSQTKSVISKTSKKIKLEQDSAQNKKFKTKRVINNTSKWQQKDYTNYWKFYIQYLIKKPHMFVSWRTWKSEHIFKEMSTYIKKTPKQCKSKDQIIKSKWNSKIDIVELALQQLEKIKNNDNQAFNLVSKFYAMHHQQSWHMRLLNLKVQQQQKKEIKLNILYEKIFSQM